MNSQSLTYRNTPAESFAKAFLPRAAGTITEGARLVGAMATAAFELISRRSLERSEEDGIVALFRLSQGMESPNPAVFQALERHSAVRR